MAPGTKLQAFNQLIYKKGHIAGKAWDAEKGPRPSAPSRTVWISGSGIDRVDIQTSVKHDPSDIQYASFFQPVSEEEADLIMRSEYRAIHGYDKSLQPGIMIAQSTTIF